MFDARDGDDVGVAGLDRPRRVDQRRQRRATESRQRRPGDRLGEPTCQQRLPGEIPSLFALLVRTAQTEIVSLPRRNVRPLDQRLEDFDHEVLGVGVGEGTVLPGLWRPYCVDDNGLSASRRASYRGVSSEVSSRERVGNRLVTALRIVPIV
ncbi:hypothetical protein C490_00240 [Natronobacterium gregoryi SP2]|uniref:Uncharacterized protein n=1 Tax=Natronobacterium gregoryi (strain ATCC 43098 / DSM 3393 / CCM 3738 / CIP 104747 / IAM 13177 / JCM 8860 / NBRC 102187 / NCIMB 2189 / SP2) TaxID=797304 RepID=L9YL09_NATGS|nr:hypothetical protein C490_00240 [Natronobacterium gregoryi SP2]